MKKNNRKKNYKAERKVSAFEERKRFCPFSQINSPSIDYKDTKLLTRYISEKTKVAKKISRIQAVSESYACNNKRRSFPGLEDLTPTLKEKKIKQQ